MEKKHFKAIIRVVKSLTGGWEFGSVDVIKEPLIMACDKEEAKAIMLEKYPQFFQNGKIYSRETKDEAQFFYVLIYELYQHEIDKLNKPWKCDGCGQVHENEYLSRPKIECNQAFMNKMFCNQDCINEFKRSMYKDIEFPDDMYYINKQGITYIYKITEKSTGKCYIGKTKNEPFFRWWNHLKHSSSPFGIYFRQTAISDWNFEVAEVLSGLPDSKVFEIESMHIRNNNSIENGYNTVISKKQTV